MNSLERKLQLGLAITLTVLLGLFWLVGQQALRNMTESWVASRLQHDAEGLLAAMMIQPEGVRVRWRRLDPVYSQPLSGHYYVIQFSDGTNERSRSLWDQSLEVPSLSPGETRQQLVAGPDGQKLLLLLNGYQKGGRQFTLAIAEDISPIHATRDRYLRWFAMLAILGLALILIIQRWVIRRSLRQLDQVRNEIQQLEAGDIHNLSEQVPSEVLPLVQEFNRLLRLLGQRLERSRNSLGNLAHALKGPLNLLIQYFDQAKASNGLDPALQQAALQTQRIQQLMERELKRARLAGSDTSSQRFDPQAELPELISVLQQMHADRGLHLSHSIDTNMAPFGDREDMLELLGNLLDNACKWATSKVHCTLSDRDTIRIHIEDDGEGLDEAQIQHLTERGTRLDESVAGHGLGLAIAGDIVKLYQGSINFSRSKHLGGLCVTIELPRGDHSE